MVRISKNGGDIVIISRLVPYVITASAIQSTHQHQQLRKLRFLPRWQAAAALAPMRKYELTSARTAVARAHHI